MTQAEIQTVESIFAADNVKIVRHVAFKDLKWIVEGYRSVGAKVKSKPEQGKNNEYLVSATFAK